jgi:hypothetical protein
MWMLTLCLVVGIILLLLALPMMFKVHSRFNRVLLIFTLGFGIYYITVFFITNYAFVYEFYFLMALQPWIFGMRYVQATNTSKFVQRLKWFGIVVYASVILGLFVAGYIEM